MGYGWEVLRVGDANDMDRIQHALEVFRQTKGRPTIIILDSHIGYGPPHKRDPARGHGEPRGEEAVRLTKRSYGWPEEARFLVPAAADEDFTAESPGGKNLHFGIREHAMAATVNGLALSKLRAFGATFFIFSDYARPAIRLSAVMELPTIFVFTHDAMGDGEDGPTHQPVEQLASLRAIPGLITLRPGDANEVVEAYRYVMQRRHEPAVLALSRQPLPTLDRNKYAPASGLARGAYILGDAPTGEPEVILIASGSEVSLAVEAHEQLLADGIRSRVVSLPSWDIFEHQTQAYRDSVLPPSVTARVAV